LVGIPPDERDDGSREACKLTGTGSNGLDPLL